MQVRDAVEADAEAMAAIADAPVDVMRNLVHDRTVRVAEVEQGETDEPVPDEEDGDRRPVGFVSYDVRDGTVHVTQIEGTTTAVERLLTEPVRYARGEGMDVELLLPDDETDARETVREVGFDSVGDGPRFEGRSTTRFRLEP